MNFRVEESKIVFKEFFNIEKSRVCWEQFDGTMGDAATRYVIRRGESVGIIPVSGDGGDVVLVKQFRYPAAGRGFNGYLWEIPAGMVHGQESPSDTAKRELFEEIGMLVKELKPLISFFLSPGALDEKLHLFIARVPEGSTLGSVGGSREEHENLLIKRFSKDELLGMIRCGEIIDAKTIAALLYYFCTGINWSAE